MTNAFVYPGSNRSSFTHMLGLVAEGVGVRVTVEPEQWQHSKCYGVVRLTKLQHYLQVNLYGADGSIAYSYRDFCFGILDDRFSKLREECARDIYQRAKTVAARIQELHPNVKVEIMTEAPDGSMRQAS